jgi:branched-chain amino acid transport system permease protein
MFGFSRAQSIAFVVMVVLIVVSPFVLYPVFLMRVLTAALFASAFNLMIGYVGLLSFGQAAFFGMGSYVTAWTMKTWHVDASIAIIFGGLTGTALGLVLGYLAIRRSGIYFAMITLALAQMVYFFCLEAPFTGGEDGIQQVPRGYLFGFINLNNDMTMYWVTAAVFLMGFLLVHRIIHSPFGQVLKGIRENEPRATSLGYRTDDYKLIAFVLSCTIAGVAGGTKAHRRALLDVGRGRADHAARRAGHRVWPGDGRAGGDLDGELPGAVWRLGDGNPGGDLHGLRAGVPPGDHWRAGSVPADFAVTNATFRAARRSYARPPAARVRWAACFARLPHTAMLHHRRALPRVRSMNTSVHP